MATQSIELSDQLVRFVEDQVSTGRYKTANEVIEAALVELKRMKLEDEKKRSVLRSLAQEARDEVERGEATLLHTDEEIAEHIGRISLKVEARRSALNASQ